MIVFKKTINNNLTLQTFIYKNILLKDYKFIVKQ